MRDTLAFRCASIVMNASSRERATALRRYLAVCEVEARCTAFGETKSAAVAVVAAKNGVVTGTVWRWLRWIEGVERCPARRLRWMLGRRSREMHPQHRRMLEEALHVGS